MKAYNSYLSALKRGYTGALQLVLDNGDMAVVVDKSNYDIGFNLPDMLKKLNCTVLDACRLFGLYRLFKTGTKVLKFSQDYADAFMHTDVNLQLSDYAQPHDVMFVDFPENFIEEHFKKFDPDNFFEVKVKPETAMVWFDFKEKALFVEVWFSDKTAICKLLTNPSNDLNEALYETIQGGETVSAEENKVFSYAFRVVLNAMLTADGHLDSKGYENQSYADKLDKYVKISKTEEKKFLAQLDKQTLPFVFSYSRKTVTYHKSKGSGSSTSSGKIVEPHWRRGHYRLQRFGQGLSESKRLRIAPVFVNFHMVPGINLSNTNTEFDINNELPDNE